MKESAFCVGDLVKTSSRIGLITGKNVVKYGINVKQRKIIFYVLWGVTNVVKKYEEEILYDMVDSAISR